MEFARRQAGKVPLGRELSGRRRQSEALAYAMGLTAELAGLGELGLALFHELADSVAHDQLQKLRAVYCAADELKADRAVELAGRGT
ncbi:hypothetical protein D9M69_686240 [compost metagenome]